MRLIPDLRTVGRPEQTSRSLRGRDFLRHRLIEPLQPGLRGGRKEDRPAVGRYRSIGHAVTVRRGNREASDGKIGRSLQHPPARDTEAEYRSKGGCPRHDPRPSRSVAGRRRRDDEVGRAADHLIEHAARFTDIADTLSGIAHQAIGKQRADFTGNISRKRRPVHFPRQHSRENV